MTTDNKLITFIIPTIGRPTLINAIKSLEYQTVTEWNAFIIFDGFNEADIIACYPKEYWKDNITIASCGKKGDITLNGNAGEVRNIGLNEVAIDTEWIGFLDDDDRLTPNYIEVLKLHQDKDFVIFRMHNLDGRILPPVGDVDFRESFVGISFAVKTKLVRDHNIRFKQSTIEDFTFLCELRDLTKNFVITEEVCYLVRK